MKIAYVRASFEEFKIMHFIKLSIFCCLLAGCGGSGGNAVAVGPDVPPVVVPPPPVVPPPVVIPPPVVPPPVVTPPDFIASVQAQNLAATQANVPLSFGHIFAKGDVSSTQSLIAKLSDGTVLPLQVDVKAKHDDGSLRHAVLSATLPQLNAGTTETIKLIKNNSPFAPAVAGTPAGLLAAGFTATVKLTLGGQNYSASADSLLRSGKYTNWLAGSIANEWLVSTPLKNDQGVEHSHLNARFAIRAYPGQNNARVDVTLENNWAYEAGPQNLSYDVQILVGGVPVYNKLALNHYHHARWRKIFWWGSAPQVHLQHDTAYLIKSKAVANYDQTIKIAAATLANLKDRYAKAPTEPMGTGLTMREMGAGGGRPDIGLLPGWAVSYLLSMDKDAKLATLGTADLAASWSAHYRDKLTDKPVSILDYPYMTIWGNPSDTFNPVTQKRESFPACGGVCTNPNLIDTAHEPSFAYLPYLLTGDYFYLEELQFWTMYNLFQSNPTYRSFSKGLMHQTEVRGQAWMLRTLAEAAYITPDADGLKKQFETFLADNLDWYNAAYTNNPKPENNLGFITEYAIIYGAKIGMAPWQDDFFTSAAGFVSELGFSKAKPLLDWKAKFPVSRMIAPDFCWIVASYYPFNVRDSESSPVYTSMGQVYRASKPASFTSLPCGGAEMAASLSLRVGEMVGYAFDNQGYPSNMQPALAYSANTGIAGAAAAWSVFNNRTIKPDYSSAPQFAIIPR